MRRILLVCLFLGASSVKALEWWEEELDKAARPGEPRAVGRALWTQGYVEVVGEAGCDPAEALNQADCYVRARKAAIALAHEKLSETINGIVVDGQTLLKNELLRSSTLRTKTRGLVRGARVVNEARITLEDGSLLARVWVRVPLRGEGSLGEVVLDHLAQVPDRTPPPTFRAEEPASQEVFSGIVVDATGLDVVAAHAPKLLVLEDLAAALSLDQVDLQLARRVGMVEYASSLEEARSLVDRVGEHPLVLRAVRVHGDTKCDLVISATDGKRLAAADPRGELVRGCRVAFVGPFL